jgi:hypothetical protein
MKTSIKSLCNLLLIAGFCNLGFAQGIKYTRKDSVTIDTIQFIVHNDMARYFSGSFWAGIEIPLKNKSALAISGIGTYGSPDFNRSHQYTGWGVEFQYRNFLGKKGSITKTPVYFAPHLIYRNLKLTDWEKFDTYNDKNDPKKDDPVNYTQNFQVFYGGIVIGSEIFAGDMFTLDVFFGGGIRVTKDLDKNAPYKVPVRDVTMTDIRYSGVVPRVGFRIGIINH